MNSANYRVRRATTDDLDQLILLWQSTQLPAQELDKRFTEFQIVEDKDGKLLGAIGLQIIGAEGKIHSEAYSDFGLTDQLRPRLWERLRSIANNHGLFRFWTDEPAPFWKKECGFIDATADVMGKIPANFTGGKTSWFFLQLKEDRAEANSLDAEFARFKAEEKENTDKMFQKARLFKGIAWGLAGLLFVFVTIGVVYLMRYKNNLPR